MNEHTNDGLTPEQRLLRAIFGKPGKHPEHPCPTDDCPGDARYVPPGRGHDSDCPYLRTSFGEVSR